MRTTLTLDDDVARKLKELAHRRRVTFKEVVNDVLRRGLSVRTLLEEEGEPYRVSTFRSGMRPGVDPQRLNQLSDDLESLHDRERMQGEEDR